MPGCSKRYTDPSSLRKHVKNHSVRDTHHQHTAAHSSVVRRRNARAQLSLELGGGGGKARRFSDSSASLYAPDEAAAATPLATPCTAFTTTAEAQAHTHFSFADCFGELAAGEETSSDSNNATAATTTTTAEVQNGSMSFHALSDCIVTIQNGEAEVQLQQQQQQEHVGVGVDEYVSFECVKKLLLDEQTSMDYNIDQTMQSAPFDIDYFNGIM